MDDAEDQVRRLRAEVAAKAAELREARAAEQETSDECERLSRELAAERLRAKASCQKAVGSVGAVPLFCCAAGCHLMPP